MLYICVISEATKTVTSVFWLCL